RGSYADRYRPCDGCRSLRCNRNAAALGRTCRVRNVLSGEQPRRPGSLTAFPPRTTLTATWTAARVAAEAAKPLPDPPVEYSDDWPAAICVNGQSVLPVDGQLFSPLAARRISPPVASCSPRPAVGWLAQGLHPPSVGGFGEPVRSEEHTSELQSRENLV